MGLHEERICAQGVGTIYVVDAFGGGQDENPDRVEFRPVANFGEQLEAVHSGKLQVEKDNSGQGKAAAILVSPGPGEVRQAFLAICDDMDGIGEFELSKSA